MKILEWRIVMPMTVEQYQIAQIYAVAKKTLDDSNDKEGIQRTSFESCKYNDKDAIHSTYLYNFANKLPAALRWVIPNNYQTLCEECYDQFPNQQSTFNLKDNNDTLKMTITTRVSEFKNNLENLDEDDAELYTADELSQRVVRYIDILNWPTSSEDRKLSEFECEKANIEKLPVSGTNVKDALPEWVKEYKGPMVIARKIIKINIDLFAIAGATEEFISHEFMPNIYADSHQFMVKTAENWCDMDLKGAREYESKCYDKVKTMLVKAESQ